MTEIESDIETVTVTFEDLKANLDHYHSLMGSKRLVITFEGKQIAVVGRWIPDEGGRCMGVRWHELLHEMYPELIDPEDREPGMIGLEMSRGYRPSSTSILRP
jgi:hypothetical protein